MGIAQAFWTLGQPSYPTSNFLYMVNRSRMMVDAITTIFAYTADQTLDTFLANRMMKDAVAKNLEVVGESANQLSTGLKDRNSHIPWNDIIDLRHR